MMKRQQTRSYTTIEKSSSSLIRRANTKEDSLKSKKLRKSLKRRRWRSNKDLKKLILDSMKRSKCAIYNPAYQPMPIASYCDTV